MNPPDEKTIVRKIDTLASWQKQIEELTAKKNEVAEGLLAEKTRHLDALIPQSVRDAIGKLNDDYAGQIAALEAEFAQKGKASQENYSILEKEIRADVVVLGKTVTGEKLQVVYTPGRVSWNDDALSGFAKAHPEILEYRNPGEPYASIKKVTKKSK